jgi:hypothetical protein
VFEGAGLNSPVGTRSASAACSAAVLVPRRLVASYPCPDKGDQAKADDPGRDDDPSDSHAVEYDGLPPGLLRSRTVATFAAPHLLAAAKLLLFQADLFVRGLADHHSSNASRSREEPESFNAGEAHRLTFAPRVFFLEVVRVDCEHPARPESYRRHGLVARFGADITVPIRSSPWPPAIALQDFTHSCGCKIHGAGRPGEGLEVLAEQPGARREGLTSFNHALFNRAFKHWTWQGLISIKRGGTRDEKRKR